MGCVIALISGLLYLRHSPAWSVTASVSGFFLITGITLPTILRPIEYVWMKLAIVMGFVMTNVLLTLVYMIAITPIGLIMRLLGKTPLKLRFDRECGSYWLPVDPSGPCGRPDKPY